MLLERLVVGTRPLIGEVEGLRDSGLEASGTGHELVAAGVRDVILLGVHCELVVDSEDLGLA